MAFTYSLAQYVAHKTNVAQQFTQQKHYRLTHLGQGILGPAPAIYASQHTILPSAFSIMPPQDPTWHMDTGDLYPVTKPPTLPIAFLSTSASTWHQRLGHPGDSLILSNFCYNEAAILVLVEVFLPCDKHKFHADGTLSRYKARLVANGSSQQLGVDFDKTFNPVVKPATIRMVLSLAVSRKWPIHQLDVKNAFLNGDLSETVYMHQPPDFVDGSQVAYHLLYVDDNILTASSTTLLQQLIDSLHREFDMTDLGVLNYFLGISVVRHSTSLFLSQQKYALQLLERAHMVNCNPSRTPVDTESKLVQQICLYMHDLREPHLAALKRILRYFQSTLDLGLHLYAFLPILLLGWLYDADLAGFVNIQSQV
ncbi:ribonuclease H-like domain-containing protein [Tanacetum coccineum]